MRVGKWVSSLRMGLQIMQRASISRVWNQFGVANSPTDPLPRAIVKIFYAPQTVTKCRERSLPDVTI
jgi:hypothetical protein